MDKQLQYLSVFGANRQPINNHHSPLKVPDPDVRSHVGRGRDGGVRRKRLAPRAREEVALLAWKNETFSMLHEHNETIERHIMR